VRAWTIERCDGGEGGGAIHSDIEKGFIGGVVGGMICWRGEFAAARESAGAAGGKSSLQEGDVICSGIAGEKSCQ